MIVFDSLGIAIVHVARTAGTMLEMSGHGELLRPHHQSVYHFRQHHPDKSNYKLWCVVRDPVMRFQSLLNLARRNHGHQPAVALTNKITLRREDLMDTDRLIKLLSKIPMHDLMDNHWSSQWQQLSIQGTIAVDRIFRFELDMPELCEALGISRPREVNVVEHREVLSESIKRFVKEKYRSDYENLPRHCDLGHWQ